MTTRPTAFALPDRLAAKAAPELIADDDLHFAAIANTLEASVADLTLRLDAARKTRAEAGGEVVERDMEIRRLTARLRTLERYGLDLCLGRMVAQDAAEPVYIGRLGLTDADGAALLVDWRSPIAEPFFGATHANPMGLASRRRYRWTRGKVGDYWDEVFTAEGLEHGGALDDQSAFIASLGGSRSSRMRDVLGTIQADQDAIIRAGSRGALVVDGGPGTGKTVVALHRTAYLIYSEPRLQQHRSGVLFVGPSHGYLAYVADVLPSLGEEGVQICTLRDLVPEGSGAVPEASALKSSAEMLRAVENAVRWYERPPTESLVVETEWADARLDPADWAEAFDAPEPGVPHNEARDQIWDALLDILADQHDDDAPKGAVRHSLRNNGELLAAFNCAWPLLDPVGVVADLWSVPAYLRRCAPWLIPAEIDALQRAEPRAWSTADLPLLDAARARIGDPEATRREHRRAAQVAAEREQIARVVDDLIAADLGDGGEVWMLKHQAMQDTLIDAAGLPAPDPDLLSGPFAHIVVDEAQELTDAEWSMLLRRCPSRSFSIVGDRAQARHEFTETWEERLKRVGLGDVAIASLTINYRTPVEVMAEAEPVIRAAIPDANVPTSIRSTGVPVLHAAVDQLEPILDEWLAGNADGVAAVIGDARLEPRARVRVLTPELAKGLEFDLVILIDPDSFGAGIEGAVDRYVAMTRATQRLVALEAG